MTAAADVAFFDADFLGELEQLAAEVVARPVPVADLAQRFSEFLAPDEQGPPPLDEEAFATLPAAAMAERANRLLETCREGPERAAVQAVENFIVFFQTLVPALTSEGAAQVARFFFRLVPTLIHIAWHDFGEDAASALEGAAALENLETILIEISDVRLAPAESELVFRSIDQLAGFIAVGEYVMASQIVSAQLLDIIARNKLARALYRLMEAEVAVQVYLKARLGRSTPRLELPGDLEALSDFGPLRVFEEDVLGERQRLVQVHIPGLSRLTDVVLHMARSDGVEPHALRLDALGTAVLPDSAGEFQIGLAWEPPRRERPGRPSRGG